MPSISSQDPQGQLIALHNANVTLNKGVSAKEDSWMVQWCTTNWATLLQPAPLSVALLASIIVLASNVSDFSLATEGGHKWDFIHNINSFKGCLMQMVNAGHDSFEVAHYQMDIIEKSASLMPAKIKEMVTILFQSGEDFDETDEGIFLEKMATLKELSEKCLKAASKAYDGFTDMSGLAGELVEACTVRTGANEQELEKNTISVEVLKASKERSETLLKDTRKSFTMVQDAYAKSQDGFRKAADNIPTGWELAGMSTIDSLTKFANTAGNAYITHLTMASQLAMQGAGVLAGSINANAPKTSGDTATTPGVAPAANAPAAHQPATNTRAAALTDPAIPYLPMFIDQTKLFSLLLEGGKDGGADWARISTSDPTQKSGAQYIKSNLEDLKSNLKSGQSISDEVTPILEGLLKEITSLIKTAKSQGSDEEKAKAMIPVIKKYNASLQELYTRILLATNSTGAVPPTPFTQPPAADTKSSAQLAVESARFDIETQKAVLESTKDTYEKLTTEMNGQEKALTETIKNLTALNLRNLTLDKMLPVLRQAVGAFSTLKDQIGTLVRFFGSISALIDGVMQPTVNDLLRSAKVIESSMVAGKPVKQYHLENIYQQAQIPMKVAMLAEKISGAYVRVSNEHIFPMKSQLGLLMQWPQTGDPTIQAKLEKQQASIQKQAEAASKAIGDMIRADQAEFAKSIDTRLKQINKTLEPILPPAPRPAILDKVVKEHVKDVVQSTKAAAQKNPISKGLTPSLDDL